MRREYDLKGGRPSSYATKLGRGGRKALVERSLQAERLVRLDDDVAASFTTEESVNQALRLVLRLRDVAPKPPKKGRTCVPARTSRHKRSR